jgi:hypothetical protein
MVMKFKELLVLDAARLPNDKVQITWHRWDGDRVSRQYTYVIGTAMHSRCK